MTLQKRVEFDIVSLVVFFEIRNFLKFVGFLLLSHQFVVHDFIWRFKISIIINMALNHVTAPYSAKQFHCTCAIDRRFVTSKYVQALHTIRFYVLQVFNGHCSFNINLLP